MSSWNHLLEFPVFKNAEYETLKHGLKGLKWGGIDYFEKNIVDKLKILFLLFTTSIIMTLMILNVAWHPVTLEHVALHLEGLLAFGQIYIKIGVVFLNWTNVRCAIEDMKYFSPVVSELSRSDIKALKVTVKIFVVGIILTCATYIVKPFITADHELPIVCYIPDYPYGKAMVYVVYLLATGFGVPFIFGFDLLFVSLCFYSVAQFKILAANLSKIHQQTMDSVVNMVNFHKFLLRYLLIYC